MWRPYLLVAVLLMTSSAQQQVTTNKVLDVQSSCDKEHMTVYLEMTKPFKGLVFSKEFSRECKVQGNHRKQVTLQLPSNACGVRTSKINSTTDSDDEKPLYHTIELIVQMDKLLQQISDQEISVRCKLPANAMRINSPALEGVVSNKLREMDGQDAKRTRTGRNRQGWSVSASEQQRLVAGGRAWMQLAPAASGARGDTVEVGQPTDLLVQCKLPVGVGFRVTNCIAHDGVGEASQKLLDEAGCPIDETIFTKPIIHKHKYGGSEIDFSELEDIDYQKNAAFIEQDEMFRNIMTNQHAITTFAAFKFPDRAKLHLICGIELCKGDCPPINCSVLQKPQQTRDGLLRKARLDKNAKGNVIDRIEVYNSIEVLAPNIELEDEASIRGSKRLESVQPEFVRGFSPGDKTICLSPGKMALAFCILGVIFICAIAVAFISLIRARRRLRRETLHTSLSLYTGSKSLFSSSGSSSSGLSGSKMLLTDSPYMDHHSSSSHNWPYSRAF